MNHGIGRRSVSCMNKTHPQFALVKDSLNNKALAYNCERLINTSGMGFIDTSAGVGP